MASVQRTEDHPEVVRSVPDQAPPRNTPRRAGGRARRVAVPLATAAVGGLALAGIPVARRLRRHLPPAVADLVTGAALSGVGWVVLTVSERVAPFRPSWNEPNGEEMTDLAYLTVVLPPTAAVSQALAMAASAPLVRARRPDGASGAVARLPLPAQVAVALLVTEFIHYWHHRLAHEVKPLWRAHAIHHSEKRMYWLTGARFHPADEIPLVAAQAFALALLGLDADAMVVHNIFKSVHGLLQHANIDGTSGPLNHVLSGPELHRSHHSQERGRHSVNYGAVLCVWDRVFGTAALPEPGGFTGEVGLRSMPGFPTATGPQLLAPFRWDAVTRHAAVGAADVPVGPRSSPDGGRPPEGAVRAGRRR